MECHAAAAVLAFTQFATVSCIHYSASVDCVIYATKAFPEAEKSGYQYLPVKHEKYS